MANKNAIHLRELADAELEARLAETKQELFNLRFQLVTGQQDNTAQVGRAKRTVARIETILREREIAAAEAAEAQAKTQAKAQETKA